MGERRHSLGGRLPLPRLGDKPRTVSGHNRVTKIVSRLASGSSALRRREHDRCGKQRLAQLE